MNREIKFRGKRVDGKGWAYGMLYQYQGKLYISKEFIEYPTFSDPSGSWIYNEYEVDPTTVGQYTGLKDKNGVEIYEGDIVKLNNESEINKKEYWYPILGVECDGFSFGLDYISGGKDSDSTRWLFRNYSERFEIIGNIHENLELIRKKQ